MRADQKVDTSSFLRDRRSPVAWAPLLPSRTVLVCFLLLAGAVCAYWYLSRPTDRGWLHASYAPAASPPAKKVAPPLPRWLESVPENCSTGIGAPLDAPRVEACFAELLEGAAAAGVTPDGFPGIMCPPSVAEAGAEDGDASLVVHLVPDGGDAPPSTARLVNSFLATQCCSAQLWVWLLPGTGPVPGPAAGELPSAEALAAHFNVPAGVAQGRLLVRRLDVQALWRQVAERPQASAGGDTGTAGGGTAWPEFAGLAASGPVPAPLAAQPRLLVAAAWGGVLVDRYTILLRDLSPLLRCRGSSGSTPCAAPPFFYRWSGGPNMYPALLHIGRAGTRSSAFTRAALARIAAGGDIVTSFGAALQADVTCRADAVCRGTAAVDGSSDAPRLFPSLLFDPLWMRHDGGEIPSILAAHLPRLPNMPAYFAPAADPTPHPEPRAAAAAFFRGLFAHNWHHKDGLAAAPGSWAAALDSGFAALAADKAAMCERSVQSLQ